MRKNVREFLEYIDRRITLLEAELERLEQARESILRNGYQTDSTGTPICDATQKAVC